MSNYNYTQALINAYNTGNNELLLRIIGTGKDCWNWGLAFSCTAGHKGLVSFMIEHGANKFDWGLAEACSQGHSELALLMIEKGANSWDWGLGCAYENNHKELILLMIEHGADISNNYMGLDRVDLEYLVKKDVRIHDISPYFVESVCISLKNKMVNDLLSHKLPKDLVSIHDLYS